MIEPLRNMKEFGSRDEAEAARLLGTLGPAEPPSAVEQRVYANLGKPPRLGPRALRLASVTSFSLVAAGVLAMAVGMFLHRGIETRAPSTSVAPAPSPAVVESVAPPTPEPAPQLVPASKPETFAPRAEPRTVPRAGLARAALPIRRRAQPAESVAPSTPVPSVPSPTPAVEPVESSEARVAAAPPEEAALVLAGLRALRRQHDPAQAAVLLARYLNRFPQGALVQEAMAIAIEADLARGDDQAAAQLAGKYLDRFPAGRFVRLARKAADPAAP